MTKILVGTWDPVQELTHLLDTLSAEILAGPDIRVTASMSKEEAEPVAAKIRQIAAAADPDSFPILIPKDLDRHRQRPISRN
jgi:hypothetical protein